MSPSAEPATRFAERAVSTRGDDGRTETVHVWIDHADVDGGVWVVGRASGLAQRPTPATLPGDVVFRGFELGDALEAANGALEDEVAVAEAEEGDANAGVLPFTESELTRRLERWFFDRANARR